MSGQDTRRRHDAVSVPTGLESPLAKLVYLGVAVREEATADEICDALALDKGTVLAIARTLRDEGHVRRERGRYVLAESC